MLKERLFAIRQEIMSFSYKEKLFILCAMLCSFCITAEYAMARPVSNSVFIYAYGSKLFPYAWLAVVPLNLLLVSLYNRYLPKLGCTRMFLIIVSSVMGMDLFCALFLKKLFLLPFIFYVWKEIYILL